VEGRDLSSRRTQRTVSAWICSTIRLMLLFDGRKTPPAEAAPAGWVSVAGSSFATTSRWADMVKIRLPLQSLGVACQPLLGALAKSLAAFRHLSSFSWPASILPPRAARMCLYAYPGTHQLEAPRHYHQPDAALVRPPVSCAISSGETVSRAPAARRHPFSERAELC
jgi:hypothetical protein